MANQIEAIGNYLGSVGNRIIGRDVYMEMKSYNRGLALMLAGYQIILPFILSRQMINTYDDAKDSYAATAGKVLALGLTEIAVHAPTIFLLALEKPAEAAAAKLVTNAVVHMGLDAATTVANKIRTHRPSSTTLAI